MYLKPIVMLITFVPFFSSCTIFGEKEMTSLEISRNHSNERSRVVSTQLSGAKLSLAVSERLNHDGIFREMIEPMSQGHLAVSEKMARSYLSKYPAHPMALEVLATSLCMQGKWPLAAYYVNLLPEVEQDKPAILNIKGITAFQMAKGILDYEMAQSYFQRAYEMGTKESISAGLNLGIIYSSLGNFEGARAIYASVRELCDDCIAAREGLGLSFLALSALEDADRLLSSVAEERNDDESRLLLALVYMRMKNKHEDAVSLLKKIIYNNEQGQPEIEQHASVLLTELLQEQRNIAQPLKQWQTYSQVQPSSQVVAPDIENNYIPTSDILDLSDRGKPANPPK